MVKDEIKEIEKHELSKASIVILGELVDILKYIKDLYIILIINLEDLNFGEIINSIFMI